MVFLHIATLERTLVKLAVDSQLVCGLFMRFTNTEILASLAMLTHGTAYKQMSFIIRPIDRVILVLNSPAPIIHVATPLPKTNTYRNLVLIFVPTEWIVSP